MTPRSGDETGPVTIDYGNLASAVVEDGEVSLTTTDETVFTAQLSSTAGVSVSDVRCHVRWLGSVRSDVISCRNDVELAAGELERQAADLDWEGAHQTYERARQRLDETLVGVLATEQFDPVTLAPELVAAGRELERARARWHIHRAESQLDLAQQLLGIDAHDQCRKVLQQVQDYAGTASGCGHAVQRGDRFQFGEQRDLQRELDGLRWRIGAFAAELVTGARDACVAAQEASNRTTAIEQYQTALEWYGHALTLENQRDERQLIDSPETVRQERDRVAAQLIDLHERIADEHWDSGVDRQEAGERDAALQACLDAKEQFERAHELAVEFAPDRADTVAARRKTIADIIAQMRSAETVSERPPETTSGATDSSGDNSVTDLADIDTHHDIVFEVDELGSAAAPPEEGQAPTPADPDDAHATTTGDPDGDSTTDQPTPEDPL